MSCSRRRNVLFRLSPAFLCLLLMACAARQGSDLNIEIGDTITHRVKAGDTWKSLATEYYADPGRAASLAAYNGGDLETGPVPGSGIRIPMTFADRRGFERLIEASDHYNEGLELASVGKYAEATLKFEKALEIDPSFVDAAFNLGVTSQKLGMHQKAIEIFGSIDLRAIGRSEYYYALGASYFHVRQYDKAEDAFEKALGLDPVHLKALYSLSVIYEKTGEAEKAADLLGTYIANAPPGAWKDQAEARLKALK